MSEPCTRSFDEAMLSGYVDGALTQAGEQRVRIHLEDCEACRLVVAELRSMRDLTMTSSFRVPEDTQWSEAPRGLASRISRSLGWTLVIGWLIAVAVMVLVAWWQSNEPLWEKLLPLSGVIGVALLLIGVLLDRLKALKTDRYREVQK